MSNSKSKSPMVYDVRVVARNLGDGTLTAKDVQAHLAALPDVAGKAASFDTSLRGLGREEEDDAGDDQEG